jgi:nitric oxide reductase subunit B
MSDERTQDDAQAGTGPATSLAWADFNRLASCCPSRRHATLTFMRGALVAFAVAAIGGLLAVLYYLPPAASVLQGLGLDMRSLRPLHVTFAAAWIFLAGQTVVHRYLQDEGGGLTGWPCRLFKVQVLLWALAGLVILVTLPLGITSGREYMGAHPAVSILILGGWLCFAWNFFSVVGKGFWSRPVYVTMWGVGTLFFIVTFLEQHGWLLPEIFTDPVVDKRIQFKATGTLVGSMNLFVYGSVIYIGEKLSGDKSYGQSKLAYSLFGVGLLNSFTNFAHHTYHLPQSHLVKQISFVVSMAEILIFFSVVSSLVVALRARSDSVSCTTRSLLASSKWWTGAMLFSSLLLSIPVLNSLVHGTLLVAGHAMGTMIGIDTIGMLAVLTALLAEILGAREGRQAAGVLDGRAVCWSVLGINVCAAAVVTWLHFVGMADGYFRFLVPLGEAYVRPAWLAATVSPVFALFGSGLFVAFALFLGRLLPLAFRGFRREVVEAAAELEAEAT